MDIPTLSDTVVEAAAFRQCLVGSDTSDLEVYINAAHGDFSTDRHRIYAHMMLMLEDHAHQILNLHLQYNQLSIGRLFTPFINMLGRAPRLQELN